MVSSLGLHIILRFVRPENGNGSRVMQTSVADIHTANESSQTTDKQDEPTQTPITDQATLGATTCEQGSEGPHLITGFWGLRSVEVLGLSGIQLVGLWTNDFIGFAHVCIFKLCASFIALLLYPPVPGRLTDNCLKNMWNTSKKPPWSSSQRTGNFRYRVLGRYTLKRFFTRFLAKLLIINAVLQLYRDRKYKII